MQDKMTSGIPLTSFGSGGASTDWSSRVDFEMAGQRAAAADAYAALPSAGMRCQFAKRRRPRRGVGELVGRADDETVERETRVENEAARGSRRRGRRRGRDLHRRGLEAEVEIGESGGRGLAGLDDVLVGDLVRVGDPGCFPVACGDSCPAGVVGLE